MRDIIFEKKNRGVSVPRVKNKKKYVTVTLNKNGKESTDKQCYALVFRFRNGAHIGFSETGYVKVALCASNNVVWFSKANSNKGYKLTEMKGSRNTKSVSIFLPPDEFDDSDIEFMRNMCGNYPIYHIDNNVYGINLEQKIAQ